MPGMGSVSVDERFKKTRGHHQPTNLSDGLVELTVGTEVLFLDRFIKRVTDSLLGELWDIVAWFFICSRVPDGIR